jgi:hypothetical protein
VRMTWHWTETHVTRVRTIDIVWDGKPKHPVARVYCSRTLCSRVAWRRDRVAASLADWLHLFPRRDARRDVAKRLATYCAVEPAVV